MFKWWLVKWFVSIWWSNLNHYNYKDLLSAVVLKNSFLSKLLKEFEKTENIFNDLSWPASVLILGPDSKYNKVKWLRPHEFMKADYDKIVLYDTIDVNDIK